MQMDQDPRKTFRNLKHDWRHDSGFRVEFAGLMWDLEAPAGASISGTGFQMEGGVVWSPYGKDHIEMENNKGVKYAWPVEAADNVRNLRGQLLWVNPVLYPQAEA